MNAENLLGKLNEEQRATLMAWAADGLSFREMAKLAAEPEPEGFGMRVSPGAVARALEKHRMEGVERMLKSKESAAATGSRDEEAMESKLTLSMTMLMEERLIMRALQEDDAKLSLWLVRLFEQRTARAERREMAMKRYELSKGRFEASGSRPAVGDPEAMGQRERMDDMEVTEALWEARVRTFGGKNREGASTLPPMQLPNGEWYYGPGEKQPSNSQNADAKAGGGSGGNGANSETAPGIAEGGQADPATNSGAQADPPETVEAPKPIFEGEGENHLDSDGNDIPENAEGPLESNDPRVIKRLTRPKAKEEPAESAAAGPALEIVVKQAGRWLSQAKNSDAMSIYLVKRFGRSEFQQKIRMREEIEIPVEKLKEMGET